MNALPAPRRLALPSHTPDIQRMLPQAIEAEKGTLSSFFLAPAQVGNLCNEKGVKPESFYLPAHRETFKVLMMLHAEGQPADFITVTQTLRDFGMLEQAGGAAYITELFGYIPTAANCANYIESVIEQWTLREMIRVCTAGAARGYEAKDDVQSLLNSTVDDMLKVVKLLEGKRIHTRDVKELVMRSMNRIEKRLAGDWKVEFPTGIKALDYETMGFTAPMVTAICGKPSDGKAQPVDALVLTPHGYIPMGLLKAGDQVVGRDGEPHRITSIHPQGIKQVYRLTMTDGTTSESCDDHLWFTRSNADRQRNRPGKARPLHEIRKTIADGKGRKWHRLPVVDPVHFAERPSPKIDAYLLGLLLGDGGLTGTCVYFTTADEDMKQAVRDRISPNDAAIATTMPLTIRIKRQQRTNQKSDTRAALEFYGLDGRDSYHKFIPDDFKMGSIETRRQVLQGLIDTDGHVCAHGQAVEFSVTSKRLFDDVAFVARSLGGYLIPNPPRKTSCTSRGMKVQGATSYRMTIRFPDGFCPVRCKRKVARWKDGKSRMTARFIAKVEKSRTAECQCIVIDGEERLYLTNDFIPTHNSSLALNIAENLAIYHGKRVGIISLDDSDDQVMDRMIQAMSRVSFFEIRRTGKLSDNDSDAIAHAAKLIGSASDRLFIRDDGGLTPSEISATLATWKARHGLDIAIIDHIQLARAEGNTRGRTEEAEQISRTLKPMAKRFEIPLIVLSQVTEKDGEYRTKNSQALSEDANNVWTLSRVKDSTDAWINISKQKDGPRNVSVPVTYLAHCTRFTDREKNEPDQPELVNMAPPAKKGRK